MVYEISLGEKVHRLELKQIEQRWECRLDGREIGVDCVGIGSSRISLLLNGRSFDVKRAPDGTVFVGASTFSPVVKDMRSWRRQGRVRQSGPLRLTASMPGKVVRVLAGEGDAIAAGQGVLVLEAMKMQNEIKSPKTGTLRKMLVREGMNVNAGEALAVVE